MYLFFFNIETRFNYWVMSGHKCWVWFWFGLVLLLMGLFIVCTSKKKLGQIPNSTIRKNKPLLLWWAIVFWNNDIYVFWSSICAKISVCGFLVYLHCAISSPQFSFRVQRFVSVELHFCFFSIQKQNFCFDLSFIFFQWWKWSWMCWTSGWVSVAQLFFFFFDIHFYSAISTTINIPPGWE